MAEWAETHEDLDEAIRRSPWAKALLVSPALMEPTSGQVKRELLAFLVAVSLLNRIKEAERPRMTQLLETIRTRFFCDEDTYKCELPFKDIKNVVNKIFK